MELSSSTDLARGPERGSLEGHALYAAEGHHRVQRGLGSLHPAVGDEAIEGIEEFRNVR